VEHIIPESLGNIEHVLPKGWVCDTCNNYLSREVEAPFLNATYGKSSRFSMRVPSKKGRVPSVLGFHPQSRSKIELFRDREGNLSVGVADGEDEAKWVNSILSQQHGSLWIPTPKLPEANYVTSRFIAKIALEALAYRCMSIPGWNDEIVDKKELDELRNYVRIGSPKNIWAVHIRRIYPEAKDFIDNDGTLYQVLHEWDILPIPADDELAEYYVVIAIFGVEYTINTGGSELEVYLNWLKRNNNKSYLYSKSA
jgi:hypothetical protein